MKKFCALLALALMIMGSPYSGKAQSKIVINGRAQFLGEPVESLLLDRLQTDSVELTSMIDNRKRCDSGLLIKPEM